MSSVYGSDKDSSSAGSNRRLNREHTPSPLFMSAAATPATTPAALDSESFASQPPSTALDNHVSATASGTTHIPPAASGNQMYIKRHVRRRLGHAKESCDKELRKVVHAITTYVEERIQELDYDDLPPTVLPSEPASDDGGDGGDDLDPDASLSSRHSRHTSTVNSSPSSFRRHSQLPPRPPQATLQADPLQLSPGKKQTLQTPTKGSSGLTRRLSRSIHAAAIPISAASSRSPSRSRSPMPPPSGDATANMSLSSSPRLAVANRRLSRLDYDDFRPPTPPVAPVDSFMTSLQEIIAIATDVIEMPISKLTAEPKVCSDIVQKIQTIGKAWDDHPDWHGRNWYVQLLLAVASLSRVLEWFEAERQFWNFEGDDGDEAGELVTFVLKPQTHESSGTLLDDSATQQQNQHHHQPATSTASLPPPPLPPIAPSSDGIRTDPSSPALTRHSSTTDTRFLQSGSAPLGDQAVSSPGLRSSEPEFDRRLSVEPLEVNRAEASEALRQQAEEAQSLNIVLELTLDGENGEQFAWINPAWIDVIGTDPDVLIGTPIADLLAESDADVFREATRQLQEDDSHTLEVRFRIRVHPDDGDEGSKIWYREMEGKGMLMYDRSDGTPSHTMWVLKALGPPECDGVDLDVPAADLHTGDPRSAGFHRRLETEPVTPFPYWKDVPSGTVLCRICECEIPSWFFIKHNDTCNEEHRIAASVAECNESISELRNTIRELTLALDRPSSPGVPATAEYRGMPIFSPTSSSVPSPASAISQFFRPPLSARLQKASVRKLQHSLLAQVDEILQIAYDISMPSLKDDQALVPIERQRLLSPESMDRIACVRNWSKPTTDDPALAHLVNDSAMLVRSKLEEVNRLSNTVRYSEKVRQEWEEDYLSRQTAMEAAVQASREEQLAKADTVSVSAFSSMDASIGSEQGDVSSTTSEYAFEPLDMETFSYSTPMRTSSPIPAPVRGRGQWRSPAIPVNHPSSSHLSISRASTPPSISSPLALAAPIMASLDTTLDLTTPIDDTPPSFSLSPSLSTIQMSQSPSVMSAMQTIRARPAQGSIDHRFFVTPPVSPSVSPQDPRININRRPHPPVPVLSPTSSLPGISPGPISPRVSTTQPSRNAPSSIKDFEIIKPISKGAFGSVFLAKKKVTGDYYAIKMLRKADMISKNQVTNVKAERMILMKQAESPFVVKLYYTFQSKDNLYLVMEYLNGGDCAALIKSIGQLPEEWSRAYVAEVILGLEYLHNYGIIHRDLKPDNLLIDQHGHLKLTDFGLSRIGLLNRQTRDTRTGSGKASPRSVSMDSSSPVISTIDSAPGSFSSSYFNSRPNAASQTLLFHDDVSESSGSESISSMLWKKSPPTVKREAAKESPMQSFSDLTNELRSHSNANQVRTNATAHPTTGTGPGTPPAEPRFAGTPDYLAPEVILGYGEDRVVDWWALGVITYEFLYGFPPFHAESPEKVFENIISRRIDWHEEYVDFSPEARDFMERLMCIDPTKRLGYHGPQEVKDHPWVANIDWDKVMSTEPQFVPQVDDPESTDYFDPRGAIPHLFQDDEAVAVTGRPSPADSPMDDPSSRPPGAASELFSPSNDDFGTFSFKNLPVLKQANDELIRKMQASPPQDTPPMPNVPLMQTLSEPSSVLNRRRSVSQRGPKVITNPTHTPPPVDTRIPAVAGPPSPSNSTSSVGSAMSRAPSTPASANTHNRRPSEFGPVERFKQSHLDHEGHRRNSMPSRLRTSSMSSSDFAAVEPWSAQEKHSPLLDLGTPHSIDSGERERERERDRKTKDLSGLDRAVTCLLAEDNPISIKILETLLTRMGCHCVLVSDGAEAISVALGDIKFDMILMDLNMPNVDGETAARYIKSTNNKNANTPVIAVSAYSMLEPDASNSVFMATLSKPVQKADLLSVMKQLGFRISVQEGHKGSSKVLAR